MIALTAVGAAVLATTGGYLLCTATGTPPTRAPRAPGYERWRRRRRDPGRQALRSWLVEAGLESVSPAQFVGSVGAAALGGAALAFALFGGVLPALVTAVFAAAFPVGGHRRRRRGRLEAAAEAWPALLDDVRLRTGSLGRSVPQALFEAARSAPGEWKAAFASAEREWLLTTDFSRTLRLLKQEIGDPTADVVCETLLLGHEVGGANLDARLADLIEDRIVHLESRRDAASRQAGVRFARRFVLLVPLGMAVAGLSIGTGRSAYQTAGGQMAVVAGVASVAACWAWSGRLMRLPAEPRVFR